jgi:hypothetical protein
MSLSFFIPVLEGNPTMWKLVIGFIAFAAIVLFVLTKAGGDVDMSGEKHGSETAHAAAEASAPAASEAAVSAAPASAASAQ